MSRKTGRQVLLFATALLCAAAAHADLAGAQKSYAAKDFEGAFQQFLEIATLGNVTAQENLAAMYVDGEGVARDNVLGYAWAVIARENGGNAAMQNIIDQLQPHLDDKARARVKAVTDQFGKAALEARLLPAPRQTPDLPAAARCRVTQPANPDDYYPLAAQGKDLSGTVLLEVMISRDGRAHRPHVWYSVPEGVFEASGRAVGWMTAYAPAKTPDAAPCGLRYKVKFKSKGGSDARLDDAYAKAKGLAEGGDPVAQVLYGLLMFDRERDSMNPATTPTDWFLKAAQAGLPYAQYLVGIDLLRADPKAVDAENQKGLTWLQLAAANGRAEAKFALANYRLRTDPAAVSDGTVFAWLEDAVRAGHRDATLYLAALLAASPDASRRDPARALILVDTTQADFASDPTALEAIAAAQAQLGKFDEARVTQQRAVGAARKLKWDAVQLQQRLKTYESGSAWTGNLIDP